jgi:hypothetical protein
MDDASKAEQLTVENNQLINIAPVANDPETAVTGIRVVNTTRGDIAGNTVNAVGSGAIQSPVRAGIQLINVRSARIDGNVVVNIGPLTEFRSYTAAIDCLGTFEQLDVTNNTVSCNFKPPTSSFAWYAVHIRTLQVSGVVPVTGNMSFVAAKNMVYAFIGNKLTALPRGKEFVGIQGNLLESVGSVPVVDLVTDGTLTLNNNRCLLSTTKGQPVVQATVGAAIVNANYLEGQAGQKAAVFMPESAQYTILGNITSGPIQPLPSPWDKLNIIAP